MTTTNGNYGGLAEVYDRIMLDGYYDYETIARALAEAGGRRLLELGTGTGLIWLYLLKLDCDYDELTGVDLTGEMLAVARDRLGDQVRLLEQDVTSLDLGGWRADVAWSYGGPCYWASDGNGGRLLISHIRDDKATARSLRLTAEHLAPGGRLLLGVQGEHRTSAKPLSDGSAVYAQFIEPITGPPGFRKTYLLVEPDGRLWRHVIDYRVFGEAEALAMLEGCGLVPAGPPGPVFAQFVPA